MNDVDEARKLLERHREIIRQKEENAASSAELRERVRDYLERADDATDVDRLIAQRIFSLEVLVEQFERNFDTFAERTMTAALAQMEYAVRMQEDQPPQE